ncbi:energy transducer TonB [Tepidicaulis sp. LMO-SS28]|uniref:energy transducer TonB n=1 Tax=Tepidicaulis sp. LMO-SS28 TaxID=3447455 RepID=UPI003EDF99C9
MHGDTPHMAPRTLWKAIGIAAALHGAAYAWFEWSPWSEAEAPPGAPGMQVTFMAAPAPPAPPPEEEPAEEEVPEPAEEEHVEEEVVEEPPPPPPPEKPEIPLRAVEPPPPPPRPAKAELAERAPGPQGQAAQPSPSPAPYAGNADAKATYIAELQAWLARHKRYPRTARRRGQEGDAILRFVVDRAGEIRRFSLDSGTGHSLLDEEVKDMLARARPLPPVPEDFGSETVEVVITVRFNLR